MDDMNSSTEDITPQASRQHHGCSVVSSKGPHRSIHFQDYFTRHQPPSSLKRQHGARRRARPRADKISPIGPRSEAAIQIRSSSTPPSQHHSAGRQPCHGLRTHGHPASNGECPPDPRPVISTCPQYQPAGPVELEAARDVRSAERA